MKNKTPLKVTDFSVVPRGTDKSVLINPNSTTTALLWFIVKRHKFELVGTYALLSTIAWAVSEFNTAYQAFIK